MKKLIYFLLPMLFALAMLTSNIIQAQIDAYWYFGNHAGLHFTATGPVAVTDGAMNTSEGCATISDNNGNLLFYTDGIFVWNNNHVNLNPLFPLGGDPSSTQSAIITPNPEHPGEYYEMTVGAWGGYLGFVLVTTNPYSISVLGYSSYPVLICEKITAVCKGDASGNFWIIAHGFGSNDSVGKNFYVWEITSSGVVTPPSNIHIQTVGSYHGGSVYDAVAGYLKASRNGDKLVLANSGHHFGNYNDGFLEVFNFDNMTGLISQPHRFSLGQSDLPSNGRPYGVEFSLSGNCFYGTIADNYLAPYLNGVYRFETNSPWGVQVVVQQNSTNFSALQLASDGKIYVSRYNMTYLSAISDPDGTYGWIENAVSLNGKTCNAGLPNFVQCLATPPPPPTCIPTLSEWGLIILGILLIVTGALYIKRRTRTEISG
jgi:hypothetical protein